MDHNLTLLVVFFFCSASVGWFVGYITGYTVAINSRDLTQNDK